MSPKSAAQLTQLRQPNDQTLFRICMLLLKSYGRSSKLCKKRPQKTRDFGVLSVRPFQAF